MKRRITLTSVLALFLSVCLVLSACGGGPSVKIESADLDSSLATVGVMFSLSGADSADLILEFENHDSTKLDGILRYKASVSASDGNNQLKLISFSTYEKTLFEAEESTKYGDSPISSGYLVFNDASGTFDFTKYFGEGFTARCIFKVDGEEIGSEVITVK